MPANDEAATPTGPASGPPPALQMMGMIYGAITARVVQVIAKLGLCDELADGPKSAADIAAKLGAYAPWLGRLMRAGASLGVFSSDDGNVFVLTPLGATLRTGVPGSVRSLALTSGEPFNWDSVGGLYDGIMTGKTPFEQIHGMRFFDYLEANPAAGEFFNSWMTQVSQLSNAAILGAYEFTGRQTVVDVGGGHGALLAAVLAANPQATGVLCDLPATVTDISPLVDAGVADRCEVVAGDFFKNVPAGGDIYLLKTVLHDWDDAACVQILRNCREAALAGAKPAARVLAIEMVLPGVGTPHPGWGMDIIMMVLNHGGRERSEAEYADLFNQAGVELRRTIPTMGPASIVEGVLLP